MTVSVDLAGVSVFIGIPAYGPIPVLTVSALANTLQQCGVAGVDAELGIEQRGIVTVARDQVLDSFLQSGKQKLFWIDSDMVWEPESFFRMLALSTTRDVVSAAYPSKKDGVTEFQVSGTGVPETPDPYGLFEVAGLGLGFTIMDRSVCEQVANAAPRVTDDVSGRELAAAFRVDTVDGRRRGEDIAFFADIRALGHKVWLDPTIRLGHVGTKCWTGRMLDYHERTPNG